jgi:hypothetical protein
MLTVLRALAAAALAIALTACAESMPSATASVAAATEDSYFVLGVHPNNMMLEIDDVDVDRGEVVRFKNLLPLHLYGQTQGDFVVVKVKGGSMLGVHSASLMAGHTIFGVRYLPIKETLTFYVPPGKVVYITSVSFNSAAATPGVLAPTYGNDLQGARDFVAIHYPELAGHVEQGSYAVVRCGRLRCR